MCGLLILCFCVVWTNGNGAAVIGAANKAGSEDGGGGPKRSAAAAADAFCDDILTGPALGRLLSGKPMPPPPNKLDASLVSTRPVFAVVILAAA